MKKNDSYSTAFNSMFREYDIRGHVNEEELNEGSVSRIVKAYAVYLHKHNINKAVVGYDNRNCSPGFAKAAIDALLDIGIDVYNIGLTLSPVAYFAQYNLKCEGAVMITASHNPNDWSGFKLAKGYSETFEPDDIEILYNLLDAKIDETYEKGKYTEFDIRDIYINNVVSRIKMGPNKPKIAIDAGNGGAGLFVYEVFQKLGCITFQLHCDPDTSYPNYFPNPSDMKAREKLREIVLHPYIKADIGLSFDGDGDRLGVIDNNGKDIWSDIVLAVLAKQMLEKKPGAKIVYDVKCSQTLTDVIEQNGGVPIIWKTGHSYIKSKLHETHAELAGERSGHIFIAGDVYYGFDDAVFVAAKLVEFLSYQDMKISDIVNTFPRYVTSPEIKAFCKDEIKYSVIEKIVQQFKDLYPGNVIDINGARVKFDHGWGLVRASSNLPELVLIFEADTLEHLLVIRSVFKDILSRYPDISPEWENDIYSNQIDIN